MDLFNVGPREVAEMIQSESDPEVIRILVRLESAAGSGDELARMEAIGALSDLLVLERGG